VVGKNSPRNKRTIEVKAGHKCNTADTVVNNIPDVEFCAQYALNNFLPSKAPEGKKHFMYDATNKKCAICKDSDID